ncbi:hypothetical protein B0A49_12119, partial [Cryomyces minteri]
MVITFNKISILYLYLRIFIDQTFWDKTIRDKHCVNSAAFWISYSVLNIATDLFILALPIRQIVGLHLPRADKLALLGVFLLGAFVCVTTIVRMTTLASSAKDADPT